MFYCAVLEEMFDVKNEIKGKDAFGWDVWRYKGVLDEDFKHTHSADTILLVVSDWQVEARDYKDKEESTDYARVQCLLNSEDIKILHVAEKAVNKTPGHGKEPRNTLYVVEYV